MFGSGLLLEIVDDDQLLSLIVEEKNALIELLRLWESQNLLIGAIIPRLLKDVDSICMSLSLSTHPSTVDDGDGDGGGDGDDVSGGLSHISFASYHRSYYCISLATFKQIPSCSFHLTHHC
jgi:hypothetical protein